MKWRLPTAVALVIPVLAASSPGRCEAPTLLLRGTGKPAMLVELFTSEGCSNCPAADEWLARLQDHDRLWTEVVPMAFHVDYWDYLGWRDPFARATYTQRQHQYATWWAARHVYTPAFAVNGREWRGYFNGDPLPAGQEGEGGDLELKVEDGRAIVTYVPRAIGTAPATLVVHVTQLGFGLTSQVHSGENRGRDLRHAFLVTQLQSKTLKLDGATYRTEIVLEAPTVNGDRRAIAAWVVSQDELTPLQTVAGWLPAE